jgi:flagellar hook-length control protein FliK
MDSAVPLGNSQATATAANAGGSFQHADERSGSPSAPSNKTVTGPAMAAADLQFSTRAAVSEVAALGETALAPDASLAAAALGSVLTGTIAPPDHIQPSEVVNQIIQQADLYRLPGNRGVRIQLHPDDLGGVDVILRYTATNGIQLHINVEHAATGALVQAGWTELRDALAVQGITPDRLIMSVSGSTNAGNLDFSSNGNGSSRPDPGLASFLRDQSGGQRRDSSGDQRSAPGVSPISAQPTTATATNDSVRTASAARIDYRV